MNKKASNALKWIVVTIGILLGIGMAKFMTPLLFVDKNTDNIHPWAVYLLYGNLADSRSSVVSVDCDAVQKSNDASALKTYVEQGWNGFIYEPTPNSENSFKFQYKTFPVDQNINILYCSYIPNGSSTFHQYLLIETEDQEFWDYGEKKARRILVSKGTFTRDSILKIYPELADILPK